MTPERLREIAEAATPGPWVTIDARIGDSSWIQIGTLGNKSVTADVGNVANAALIVLAPDLARVTAGLAQAVAEEKRLRHRTIDQRRDEFGDRWPMATADIAIALDAALAAFEQLGEQDDTQAARNDGEATAPAKGSVI